MCITWYLTLCTFCVQSIMCIFMYLYRCTYGVDDIAHPRLTLTVNAQMRWQAPLGGIALFADSGHEKEVEERWVQVSTRKSTDPH